MTVHLAADHDPVVTLVMVVYGRFELAREALATLAATRDVPVEIVVVDNASPDRAGHRLAEALPGPSYVHSPTNLGYGTAANLGALHARAPYLAVLNSDIAPEPGWLAALVETAESDRRIASVAPLYVGDDGAVLDAGRLLGADGNGYGYGDRLRRGAPEVSFRRRLDFGTAAALLVRTSAFHEVGGFDPAYGLGYYEDTDLGFTLRAAGYDHVYDPRAVVGHLGGGSFDGGLRRRQLERNLPLFVERFGPALRGRPVVSRPPYDPHRELVLRDWLAVDRVLVLDQGTALAGIADELGRRHPEALVTWVSKGAPPARRGVDTEWIGKVPDVRRWLEGRRFHYGAVVVHGSLPGQVGDAMTHSQPQARRVVHGGTATWPDVALAPGADASAVASAVGLGPLP